MSVRHTAYLVAHIYTDPTGRMLPQVHAVRIYSENATSLSYVDKNAAAVDVYRVDGDTYQDYLTFCVQTMPPFAWCRPLMELRDVLTVQRVTFAPASNVDAIAAHEVLVKFLGTTPEHAAKVLARGTYMDADRYDMLRDAVDAAKVAMAVIWDAKSEAA